LQRDIRDVAVSRGPYRRFLEIPFGPDELGPQLIDRSLPLLDMEGAARALRLQLRHLAQPRLLELELRPDGIDLRTERRRIDPEQDVARLQRLVGLDGNVDHLAGDIGDDRDRVADHEDAALRRAQFIGMNRPMSSSSRTRTGETFQNRLKGTILRFTRMKSRAR